MGNRKQDKKYREYIKKSNAYLEEITQKNIRLGVYRKSDDLTSNLVNINRVIEYVYGLFDDVESTSSFAGRIADVVNWIIGFIVFNASLFGLGYLIMTLIFVKNVIPLNWSIFLMLVISVLISLGLAALIGGIISAPIEAKLSKGNKKTYKDAEGIIAKNIELLSFIPEEYWYPMATGYMAKMANDGRVSTRNEALKECDEYIHRCKTESALNSILEQQRRLKREIDSVSSQVDSLRWK